MTLRRRKLACRELVELVTDYLEGAMPARQRRRVERHLRACGNCAAYLEQMQDIIRAAGRIREEDVLAMPPTARRELMDAFRAAHGRA